MITLLCIHARYCYCVWCDDETANEWVKKKFLKFQFDFCKLLPPGSGHWRRYTSARSDTNSSRPPFIWQGSWSLPDSRRGRWCFISVLKLLELCSHTRVIIIIIIQTVGKRDVFLRIFIAPACLPRTHIYPNIIHIPILYTYYIISYTLQ